MTHITVAENALDEALVRKTAADAGATVSTGPVGSPSDVAASCVGADALVVTLQPLRAEHVAALPDSVRLISRAGVGLDTIDVEAARARGIRVVYQPSYATNEVADHSAAMALAAWRRLGAADGLVRENGWATAAQIGPVGSLQDATLGVLGTGRIGRSLVGKLSPFVAEVIVFDAYPDAGLTDVVWAESAADLFERSDLIALHLPLNADTRHVVDAEAIRAMPRGAVIVNVSRGGLIDEAALAAALHSGAVGAAALDVFESEPLAADSPLRSAPNLLLSPHVAWYSTESAIRLTRWSVEDAASFVGSGDVIHGTLA